jgi:hypothetical protein
MISLYSITTILICHWLADFFFQTDEMAKNKSTNNKWLAAHVGTYSCGLLAVMLLNVNAWQHAGYAAAWLWLNISAHFFTDWVTSRASSSMWKDSRFHDFFTIIGFDQTIHYITLIGTFIWLTQ